ncbi:MAG: putative bifunctional diguanylate cyclase/phosphodiesterase [Gammaproteobacteria bacterium]
MNKPSDINQNAADLRQHAERKLAAQPKSAADQAIDPGRLVHELQVHQIELELQNEALREARTTAELALERYAELFDFAPIAYFILGTDGLIRQTNCRGGLLLGCESRRLTGQHFADSVASEYRLVFKRFLEQVFASNDPQHCEIIVKAAEADRWVSIEATADSTCQSCLAAVLDISERKRREQELQLAATIYMTLEEAMIVTDENNRIVAVNPAFTQLTGYTAEEAIARPASLLKSERHDQAFYRELWDRLKNTGHWQGELWNRRKNGDEYLVRLSISTLYSDSGDAIRRVAMGYDITEKKRMEEIISKQANIDPLTGLPNRRLFLDRLQRAINKSHREHQKLALMFLDLDHFKVVNDTLGHDTGDSLLRETTERLKSCIRETDTLARPGGDEFTLIMSELDGPASIDRVAQCILQSMMAPFQLKNERCYVSVSIGIALFPDDAGNLEELLKKADQAMYTAKQQGRSRFCYFTPAMQASAESRLRLTNDLRHALADQQIWLAYQPIVELATGAIQKAEALIRWQHPTRGLISPAEFIPIAEDTGMIIEIGNWVFHQAARQVALWRSKHCSNFQISINKSPAQFYSNSDSPIYWLDYLQQLDLPGDSILVEITEGLLLNASGIVSEKLLAFRDADIQVSLDDFGTGNSSLSYLKKFDIDYLKIDQSFVSNLTANSTDLVLCEAMILMAGKLGMKVIAEGIETPEQRDLLMQAGCDYGQGCLFSRPVSAEAFEKLFQAE